MLSSSARARVRIADRELSAASWHGLTRIRLSLRANSPTQLAMEWQLSTSDELPSVATGAAVMCEFEDYRFEGKISALEIASADTGALVLKLVAYDRLEQLRRQAFVRQIPGGRAPDVVRALVEPAGLDVDFIGDPLEILPTTLGGHSHFELLNALSAALGFCFFVEGSTVKSFELDASKAPHVQLAWGALFRPRLVDNEHPAISRMTISGSHLGLSSGFSAEQSAQLGGGVEGAPRKSIVAVLGSEKEATVRALAQARRAAAEANTIEATSSLQSRLRPGQVLELEEIPIHGKRRFVLTEVVHEWGGQVEPFTRFSSKPPQAPSSNSSPSICTGQVVELDAKGRVRVRFPSFEAESGWLRVTSAGAGPSGGIAALPDLGDEVLVLSPDDDPSHGVVLGGLWADGPDDACAQVGARTGLRLNAKRQELHMNHSSDTIKLHNAEGSGIRLQGDQVEVSSPGQLELKARAGRLTLSDSLSALHAENDLLIEAPGRTITIRANKVNFEQG